MTAGGIGELLRARDGHFAFESGHHGTLWLDLDGLFARPAPVLPFARSLATLIEPYAVEVVCGPFSGGAFLAQLVAAELGTAAVYSLPVVYELPPSLISFVQGRRTALVDDVINAGSATTATLSALRAAGAEVVVVAALMTLGRTGVTRLTDAGVPVESLESRPHHLHPPETCPLCTAGVPLSG